MNKFTLFLISKRSLLLLFLSLVLIVSLFQVINSKNNFLTGIGEISGSESNYVKKILDNNFTDKISYDLIITTNQNIKSSDQNKLLDLLNNDPLIQSTYSNRDNYLLSDLTNKQANLLIINLKNSDFKTYEDYVPIIRKKIKEQFPENYLNIFVTGNAAFSYDMNYLSEKQGKQAEINVLIITLLVLFFAFSSIPGAVIAVSAGFLATIFTLAILKIITGYYELSIFCQNISTMLGLGLSIDYSLLIISRYKKELENNTTEISLINTLNSSGKSVLYSGLTVMIGFTALFIPQINLSNSIALGGSIVSLFAVILALTYTPLMLYLFSNKLNFPFKKSLNQPKFLISQKWGLFISRHSIKLTFLSITFLLITALPVFNLKLSEPDIKTMPDEMESKKGFVELQKISSSDLFYPFQIILENKNSKNINDSTSSEMELYKLSESLKKYNFDKIYTIFGEINSIDYTNYYFLKSSGLANQMLEEANKYLLSKDKKQTMIIAFPKKEIRGFELNKIIQEIRNIKSDNFKIYTGGNASVSYDLIEKLYKKFPLMIICVYLLTAIILYISYKSVLIPLKAILVNTLSVLSCYGILILIFQYGYFNFLINLKYSPESIISGLPVILFCIMFSLSMDYEVFLLSSMSEEYKISKDNNKAVITGLSNTSGIITKASVIMLIVFSAFIQADIILIKMLGVGLALAVFIDATIIRLILVPSLMNLAGNYNWLSFKDFFRLFKQVP